MKPIMKVYSTLLGLTSLFVFWMWIMLNDLILKNDQLGVLVNDNKVISIIYGAIFSVGFYNTIYSIFKFFFENKFFNSIINIKKLIMGKNYLEGCWVGYFIGDGGKVRFYYEVFEQDLDKIVMRGTAFKENGDFHCNWLATNVNFDSETGEITYYYSNDSIGNTHKNTGIASFYIIREKRSQPPIKLNGYSSDLFNPTKSESHELKISSFHDKEDKELFEKAKEFYKDTKIEEYSSIGERHE